MHSLLVLGFAPACHENADFLRHVGLIEDIVLLDFFLCEITNPRTNPIEVPFVWEWMEVVECCFFNHGWFKIFYHGKN